MTNGFRIFLFVSLGIIWYHYLLTDVMDIDAAQYASMSMEMWETGQFLEIYEAGSDYLDKPPMVFWLSSMGLGIFGVSSWAFKLIPFLCIILGYVAFFQWVKRYYTSDQAEIACYILATCQGFFLLTNDIRTDGILFGMVMCGIWCLDMFSQKGTWKWLIFGGLFTGFAMLTKGPLGFIAILVPLFFQWLVTKNWKIIFTWKWLIFLLIIAFVLAPMCWGLYYQFDMHPEKEVYGLKGPSGLKFFFWTQSFGRYTGDIYWNNEQSPFYFFQTILWDFFPWVLLLFPAWYHHIAHAKKRRDWVSFFGFTFLFILFSFSNYKLPHYIFITFPFAAVLVMQYIHNVPVWFGKFLHFTGLGLIAIVLILFGIYHAWLFPGWGEKTLWIYGVFLVSILYFIYSFRQENWLCNFMIISIMINIFLALRFYPDILMYQGSGVAGKWARDNVSSRYNIYAYKVPAHAFSFYAGKVAPVVGEEAIDTLKTDDLLVSWEAVIHPDLVEEMAFDYFPVSRLNITFLNPETREKTLEKFYLYRKK